MPRGSVARQVFGMVFGRLTIICRDPQNSRRCVVKCECGNEKVVELCSLRTGKTTSCGCFRREVTATLKLSHGMHSSREYRVWQAMISRCRYNYPENAAHAGRGIKVCERWKSSFEDFYADMGPRPRGTSIDRINNDSDYTPQNCRWATMDQQNSNKRSTVFATINGVTKPVFIWAREMGVSRKMVFGRIHRGWEVERALTTPPGKQGRHERK
jgi:hypothetical protein